MLKFLLSLPSGESSLWRSFQWDVLCQHLNTSALCSQLDHGDTESSDWAAQLAPLLWRWRQRDVFVLRRLPPSTRPIIATGPMDQCQC